MIPDGNLVLLKEKNTRNGNNVDKYKNLFLLEPF